jgi:hypothetical protein
MYLGALHVSLGVRLSLRQAENEYETIILSASCSVICIIHVSMQEQLGILGHLSSGSKTVEKGRNW